MIRCRRCGFELYENEMQCPNCGLPVRRERPQNREGYAQTGQRRPNPQYDPERRNEYRKKRKKKTLMQKIMKGAKIAAFVVVGFLALSLIIGFLAEDDGNSGTTEVNASTATNEPGKTISAPEASPETEYLEVSAEELYNAYENNEVKANSIYGGKKLCVSGYIADIGIDIMDDPYISINDGDPYSFWYVNAYFTKKSYAEEISELEKGQEIKIIGKCDGSMIIYVQLSECEIVE